MTDNPFQSPAVESTRRQPARYPKRLIIAQACGLGVAVSMLIESETFPQRDLPWPHIMFWGALITMIATASMAIPNKIVALFPLIYFLLIGCLALLSWIITLAVSVNGRSFFFLLLAMQCIVIILMLFQKRTHNHHARRL